MLPVRVAAGAVPGVFVLVALAVMAFYQLSESRHRAITAEIAERNRSTEPAG